MRLIDHIVKTANVITPGFNPSVIIDAGSRDLDQSIEFTLEFPNARILAFEPNPAQFELCLNKAKAYNNIEVFPFALSDYEGEALFHITPANIGVSSLLEPTDVPWASDNSFHTVKVQTDRLENILRRAGIDRVDLVWMDVQGGELAALQGLGDIIHNVDFIQCEAAQLAYYKGHPLRPELEKFLEEHNFKCEFFWPFEGPPHQYEEGELVCVNKRLLVV